MPNTNVELSKNELELVTNSEFILTKNRIVEKVYNLFGMLSEEYRSILNANALHLPKEIFNMPAKIYKGEQYKNLPYVMLDYPRIFSKDDVFAIRNFFWWGNFFSITLQLQGKYLQHYQHNILRYFNKEKNSDWFIGMSDSAWEHHFENDNYVLLSDVLINSSAKNILEKNFIKLAKKMELEKWNEAENFFRDNYYEIMKMLKA